MEVVVPDDLPVRLHNLRLHEYVFFDVVTMCIVQRILERFAIKRHRELRPDDHEVT